MPLFDHFDWVAPFYDRAIPLKHANQLLEHLCIPSGGFVLDAGGGTGRVAQALKQYTDRVFVVDASMGMLLQANHKKGLTMVCSQVEQLSFPTGMFDRVIMVDALHHVIDQRRAVEEMWRVLKPGGRLVIEEPDFRTGAVKLIALAEKIVLMRSHFLAPTDIVALIPQNNLGVQVAVYRFNAWIISDKSLSG